MSLILKTSFISQDKSGRFIKLKDSTGLEAHGAVNGYGVNNGKPTDILAYYFSVGRIFTPESYSFKVDGSDSYLPTPIELAYGNNITLSTSMFHDDKEEPNQAPKDIFVDGVLDINMYVEFLGMSSVVITKGNSAITGADFTIAWKADAIIVNDIIYDLDKSRDRNGNTVLYIVGTFDENATSFNLLYRSNVKALLTSMSENLHDYACKKLQENENSLEWNNVSIAMAFRRSAFGLFHAEVPDYFASNSLMYSNFKLLKKYTI